MKKNSTIISIEPHENGCRLDKFLRDKTNMPQSLIERLLRKGLIKLDKKKTQKNIRLQTNQQLDINYNFTKQDSPEAPSKINPALLNELKKSIIYQDANLLVMNKPAGLAVQGGSKINISVDDLLDTLTENFATRPKLVHRLDKDTSGLLLIAVTLESAQILTKGFQEKSIQKIYWALLSGIPSPRRGTIDNRISKQKFGKQEKMALDENGDQSITHYQVLKTFNNNTCLVELRPVTGRMHQLRLHCQLLGTPIVGDGKYGGKAAFLPNISNKLHLHAKQILIKQFQGKKLEFSADLPEHFQQSLGCKQN